MLTKKNRRKSDVRRRRGPAASSLPQQPPIAHTASSSRLATDGVEATLEKTSSSGLLLLESALDLLLELLHVELTTDSVPWK
jgi:hypothetical protein